MIEYQQKCRQFRQWRSEQVMMSSNKDPLLHNDQTSNSRGILGSGAFYAARPDVM
jgi:hypothetical protein